MSDELAAERAAAAGLLGGDEETYRALLQSIVDVARAIFAARGRLDLPPRRGGRRARLRGRLRRGRGDLVGPRFPSSTGIAGWVLVTRQPLVVDDLSDDPRFARDAPPRRATCRTASSRCRCSTTSARSACSRCSTARRDRPFGSPSWSCSPASRRRPRSRSTCSGAPAGAGRARRRPGRRARRPPGGAPRPTRTPTRPRRLLEALERLPGARVGTARRRRLPTRTNGAVRRRSLVESAPRGRAEPLGEPLSSLPADLDLDLVLVRVPKSVSTSPPSR